MNARLIGNALLVCACALFGAALERGKRARLQALESWRTAAECLRCELLYGAPPLPELLTHAADRAGGEAGRVLRLLREELAGSGDWTRACASLDRLLPEEWLAPMRELLPRLGLYPAAEQAQLVRETEKRLASSADELRRTLNAGARVTRVSSLSVGIMLALLLW